MRKLEEILGAYFGGLLTHTELYSKVYSICFEVPLERETILGELERHELDDLRRIAAEIRADFIRVESLITDLEQVRIHAPLQPGTRVRLTGGYCHSPDQWWLEGRNYRSGTFLNFYPAQEGRLPVAIFELDEVVDLTEACGRHHFGRIAIARVLYSGEPWQDGSVVMIHVEEKIPEDTGIFCETHRFGTELESNATLEIQL